MRPDERCPFIWKDEAAKVVVCPLCGKTDQSDRFTSPTLLFRLCPVRSLTRQLGWGDRVHWLLSKVGITPIRVAKLIARMKGIPLGRSAATCGGCGKRQEALNQVGWKTRWRLGRLQWWAYRAMQWLVCGPCRKQKNSRQPASVKGGATSHRLHRMGERLRPLLHPA